jgi:hypothetical protein
MYCLPLSSKTNQTLKLLFSRIQIQQYNLKIEDANAILNQLITSTVKLGYNEHAWDRPNLFVITGIC